MKSTLSNLISVICVACGATFASPVPAQTAGAPARDANAQVSNNLLTVAIEDYRISGLVTHLPEAKTFKYGIVLFPGYPSIMKLREEAGAIRFDLGGELSDPIPPALAGR